MCIHPESNFWVEGLIQVVSLYTYVLYTYINTSFLEPESPHPHPSAPIEFKNNFNDFLSKRQNYTQPASGGPKIYQNFWDLPSSFHRPKFTPYSQFEIDAIEVRKLAFKLMCLYLHMS